MTSEQILKSDMLDILFDGRNKAYGAYELRRKYDNDLGHALLVGVLITVSFFGYSYYNDIFGTKEIPPTEIIYDVSGGFKILPEQIIPEVIKAKPAAQNASKTISFTAPIISTKPIHETPIASAAELEHDNPGVISQEGIESGPVSIDPTLGVESGLNGDVVPNIPDEKEDNVVRNYVEQMPEFPGGLSALMLWLSKHLEYPKEAVRNGLEGKVITQFTVEKDGSVTNVKVIRDGVGGGAGDEAARVVGIMPGWKAGMQNDRPVRVLYTLPIAFSLK
ncbi:MAG: energy transducer TonB [Saprospiraceae bacterium]|jgi:protein TonB|uniref:energy transducer TonB n=1 Tax=Candidatus Brachybacter algidus TaxID=2982024 RepID=UPI001B572D10|nr:energy transducer TonB [Candidatus Brachybacter algidus]MBP7307442.1 energy transducer TonB [Saprospiraceae bacterium]MBK6375074.1 energy transducer TonB [Candidatus Brachybacter algidus]MBK6450483.1 energy transducer TonB [Candidatus Brachybacter algidus]MBK7605257.1 energy transducer TonB [Candidatus Brachybacter algidus]MBK8748288.1 energy transducer TonB [Candidatus Brachybacter algidus]